MKKQADPGGLQAEAVRVFCQARRCSRSGSFSYENRISKLLSGTSGSSGYSGYSGYSGAR